MSALSNEGLNGFPIPIGTILMWGNNSAKPQLVSDLEETAGFLVCDGREFAKSDYPELYATLGDVYNAYPSAPAAGNFRIPNLPNPDGAGGYKGFLLGGTSAGTLVPDNAQTPIASAEITLQANQLPTFPLDYDTATPYEANGTYYCISSQSGEEINTKVYSKSVVLVRNPSGDKFLRDDVNYSSAGGMGNDSIAPQFTYTGLDPPTPVDITASITQGTFDSPNFEIVPIIRARPSAKFNP